MSLKDIKNKKARNIVRGIIGVNNPGKISLALTKILDSCGEEAYKQVLEVIKNSQLFYKNQLAHNFLNECPRVLSKYINYNEEHILEKINYYSEKIIKLNELYHELLILVFNLDFIKALDICNVIINDGGVSCFLIRILYYINKHEHLIANYDALTDDIDDIFKKIKIFRIPFLDNAISELSSDKTDYFNISKKIENTNDDNNINLIVKSFLSKTNIFYDDFEKTLNAFYSFSIFDTFLYYSSIYRIADFPSKHHLLTSELVSAFKKISTVDSNKEIYSESLEDHIELTYFRDSFLLMELDDFFYYKIIHGSIYNTNENKKEDRSFKVNSYLKKYFSSVRTLEDLRTKKCNKNIVNLIKYERDSCNYLENTTGVIFFLENNNCQLKEEEELIFVKLMTFTRDIGSICPTSYLKLLYSNAKNKELKLVLSCLLFLKTKLHSEEFALRKDIQNIATKSFNSNIKDLFEDIYSISPSVTEYLVQICDVTFLSKLFKITDRPNKAIEDRCEMLEWFGDKSNDKAFKERAKNLRLDVQISKQKGIIDDSRIYVDPLKFTQWITDNILDQLTVILESISKTKDTTVINIDWENVDSELSLDSQITSLLLKCYKEFCTNKLFGIASYLGRRIRHGTFKGTAMKDVKDIKNKREYCNLFQDSSFNSHYIEWLKNYEDMLKDLRVSKLHVQSSEKAEGLIIPTMNSSSKKIIAKHMVIEIIKNYMKHNNSIGIPQIITEYCWRIVEEDLKNMIKIITERKSKKAVYSYKCGNKHRVFQTAVKQFTQELNGIMSEKFRTIIQWFNKPSTVSHSTSILLLFNVCVSQVRGEVAEFDPKICIPDKDLEISGGQYFSIYDALYILVYNIAEHSTLTDRLKFEINHNLNEKLVVLKITSYEANKGDLLKAQLNIESKLKEELDYEADLVEGKSGIKKLRLMKYNKYINNIKYTFHDKSIVAILELKLEY